jgi:hypothetical protein
MKSILLEMILVESQLDKLLNKFKDDYQIIADLNVVNRIKKDSIENIADGKEYKIFENNHWLISGKIDDEEPASIWVEVFKK